VGLHHCRCGLDAGAAFWQHQREILIMGKLPRALAIVGPTACGKSALGMALAEHLEAVGGAEIISMDSALVYQGMDIGTAKPSKTDQAVVPHHLIDILDPTESYSAALFAQDCLRRVQDISARGKTPLIVGGTLLYLKALTEGLDDIPRSDSEVRAKIAQRALALGWPALHAQLCAIDPVTAERLSPNDGQRIGRALEVWTMTGRPLSAFHRSGQLRQRGENAAQPQIEVLSLQPSERAWLHDRIAQRFDDMLAQGFLDEVQALRKRADLHPNLPSIRCVGYRQAWQGLDENWSLEEIRNRSIFATRQLAKRQMTWLRSWSSHTVLRCDQGFDRVVKPAWAWAQQSFTFHQKPGCQRLR
jgi:tRNA dimethylallyltransferase